MRNAAFIHDDPAYTAREAAHILNLPAATLKAWYFGQGYRSNSGARKRFQPVIRPADGAARLLSFANLCELHILSAIRRQHKIPLPKVRDSMAYVRSKLGGEFELAPTRIERNRNGMPIRLFPFSRSSATGKDQPMTVVIDPRLSFGRPVLSKVAVPTEVIMDRFRAGDSVAEMAGDYGVGEDEIEEALRFEPIGHIFPFLSGAERVAHSPYVIRPVPVNAPIRLIDVSPNVHKRLQSRKAPRSQCAIALGL